MLWSSTGTLVFGSVCAHQLVRNWDSCTTHVYSSCVYELSILAGMNHSPIGTCISLSFIGVNLHLTQSQCAELYFLLGLDMKKAAHPFRFWSAKCCYIWSWLHTEIVRCQRRSLVNKWWNSLQMFLERWLVHPWLTLCVRTHDSSTTHIHFRC
jgi:hypothetical protein